MFTGKPAIRTSTYQGRETGNDTFVTSRCFVEFTYQSLENQLSRQKTNHKVGVSNKKHEKTSGKREKWKKKKKKKKW